MLASKCKAVKNAYQCCEVEGYLEKILPPKGYLGQKSLGTTDLGVRDILNGLFTLTHPERHKWRSSSYQIIPLRAQKGNKKTELESIHS